MVKVQFSYVQDGDKQHVEVDVEGFNGVYENTQIVKQIEDTIKVIKGEKFVE